MAKSEKKNEKLISYGDTEAFSVLVSQLKNKKTLKGASLLFLIDIVEENKKLLEKRNKALEEMFNAYKIEQITVPQRNPDGTMSDRAIWNYKNHDKSEEVKEKVKEINETEIPLAKSCQIPMDEFQSLSEDLPVDVCSFLAKYLLKR